MIKLPSRRWIVISLILLAGLGILTLVGAGFMMMNMPGQSYSGPLKPLTPEEALIRDHLRRHVEQMAGKIGERNLAHYGKLQETADYIEQSLRGVSGEVTRQDFPARGKRVSNVELTLSGEGSVPQSLVIGAHYDSVEDCPAANDNGSGVAALLELARLLHGQTHGWTLHFVAFANEEAPYFGSEAMGSLVYARRARERGEKVGGMISLETIGYYSDAPGSQQYPDPLRLAYPETGNFIGFIGNLASQSLVRDMVGVFRRQAAFPSEALAAPESIPGVGASDHWAFWQMGYQAVMVTDTAPYRYPFYHTAEDTPDKLDYERMARVVAGLARMIEELTREGRPN